MMNDQVQKMNRNFGIWHGGTGTTGFALPPEDLTSISIASGSSFKNPVRSGFGSSKTGRSSWKGKKSEKRKELRRKGNENGVAGVRIGYQPPTLQELQSQNRLKARRFYPKKKFNNRFAPFAPRNTTSFIIRAKKSGGIASLVSPCPVTPAILPTPVFSPSREGLIDMAREEWGVDGYGSMKGLIRLRSPGNEIREEDSSSESESDVEEHVEVERRLDHDLSRFEMIYPSMGGSPRYENVNLLENRVDEQDMHIAHLEEENLTLKERLFLMEQELGNLRRRLQCLETGNQVGENNGASDNEGGGDVCSEKSVGDGEASCARE